MGTTVVLLHGSPAASASWPCAEEDGGGLQAKVQVRPGTLQSGWVSNGDRKRGTSCEEPEGKGGGESLESKLGFLGGRLCEEKEMGVLVEESPPNGVSASDRKAGDCPGLLLRRASFPHVSRDRPPMLQFHGWLSLNPGLRKHAFWLSRPGVPPKVEPRFRMNLIQRSVGHVGFVYPIKLPMHPFVPYFMDYYSIISFYG